MKILAETTGPFMLQDLGFQMQVIPSHRPAVVQSTSFIQTRIASSQIKVLGELVQEATDEEFKEFIRESIKDDVIDMPLAVASFLSKFGTEKLTSKVEDGLKLPKISGLPAAEAKEALTLFAMEHFDVEVDQSLSVPKMTAAVEALIAGE